MAELVSVVRCRNCIFWDKETIRRDTFEFGEENTAECEVLKERDMWGELPEEMCRTTENDYCSKAVEWGG